MTRIVTDLNNPMGVTVEQDAYPGQQAMPQPVTPQPTAPEPAIGNLFKPVEEEAQTPQARNTVNPILKPGIRSRINVWNSAIDIL